MQILKRKVLLKSKADIDKFTDLKIHFIEKNLLKRWSLSSFLLRKMMKIETFIKLFRELYVNQVISFIMTIDL